jgi:MFS family permease
VGAAYGLAILPLLRLHEGGRRSSPGQHPRNPLRAGIALIRSRPQVGRLFTISLVAEVLAFAGISLDPVFAGSVFAIGASGLGVIVGARAVGRLAGSLVLGLSTGKRPFSRLLPAAVVLFGIGLVGFALSPGIGIGVVLVFVVGIAGVLVDSLAQAAMAAAAPAAERGRAEGLWVLALGLGPIGILEISLFAQVAGPRLAQAVNGTVVLLFGLLLVVGLYGKGLALVDSVAPEVVPDPPLS